MFLAQKNPEIPVSTVLTLEPHVQWLWWHLNRNARLQDISHISGGSLRRHCSMLNCCSNYDAEVWRIPASVNPAPSIVMCKRQRLDVLLARLLAFSRMTVSVVGVSLFFFPLCQCQSGREAEMEAVSSRANSEKHLGDTQSQGPRKHTCSGSNLRDIQERSRQWFGRWLSSDNLREERCSDKHLSSLSATLPPPRHRCGNVIQCQSAQRNAIRADRSTVSRGPSSFPVRSGSSGDSELWHQLRGLPSGTLISLFTLGSPHPLLPVSVTDVEKGFDWRF